MVNFKFYLSHGITTICFDRINRLLILLCLLIPLCAFFSFSNVYFDSITYGLEAIHQRHQWFDQYQGYLDQEKLEYILESTYIAEVDSDLKTVIETIKDGYYHSDYPLTNNSILMNVVSPLQYNLVRDLCNHFLDENLDLIPMEHGYTIPDSEGMYALCSDMLPILILEALCLLLIICRSVDKIHQNRFVLLERSYCNTKRLYGYYYLCVMGMITLFYGYTILVLLGLYKWAYQGLGMDGSFALWSNSYQSAFDGLTIVDYFGLIVLSYYLLLLVVTNVYMVFSMKMDGFFAWILSSGIFLIIFALLSDATFGGITGIGVGLFILHNGYTFFSFKYGFTIGILLIQFIVYYGIGVFWLNHSYYSLR